MKEPSKAAIRAAWITGLLGCIGVTIAALIGLGLPFVQRIVAPTPVVIVVNATAPQPIADTATPNTPTSSSILPTYTPTLPTEVDCSFDFSSLAIFVERTGGGNTVSYDLSEPAFPRGYVIGHGVEAYINDQSLRRMGDGGVTFMYPFRWLGIEFLPSNHSIAGSKDGACLPQLAASQASVR